MAHIVVPVQYYALEEEIAQEKEAYSRIIDIQGNINILIEYIL
ncbi:MAG: hypothetical protein WCP92_09205 [bacterium]